MPSQIIRRLKPEEEEVLRKRAELAAIQATVAERELELAEFRRQLAAFEARYLRLVGGFYSELDDWNARIAELRARQTPSAGATQEAEAARRQADQTKEEAHRETESAPPFDPSPELKSLFREVAKRVHPDLGMDDADREKRTRLMADANRAYQAGDIDSLRRILAEFSGLDDDPGEGTGAELVRIIRQIAQAQTRLAEIEQELATLQQSDAAQLRRDEELARDTGRDLLAELRADLVEKIKQAVREHDSLADAGKDS